MNKYVEVIVNVQQKEIVGGKHKSTFKSNF